MQERLKFRIRSSIHGAAKNLVFGQYFGYPPCHLSWENSPGPHPDSTPLKLFGLAPNQFLPPLKCQNVSQINFSLSNVKKIAENQY